MLFRNVIKLQSYHFRSLFDWRRKKSKSMKYFLIVISIVLLSTAVIGQNRKERKTIDAYLQVSNQKMGSKFMPLMKWNQDSIGYYIYGKMKGMTENNWRRFLNKVERVSGLHFYPVENNKDAQILLYFGKVSEYFKYEGIKNKFKIDSKVVVWSDRDYDYSFGLRRTSFCIDKDEIHNFNQIKYMIKHEFLKSLGLFGKLDGSTCILSEKYSQKKKNISLRSVDKACIAIHYSDNIKSEMSKAEVKMAIKALDLEPLLKRR